MVFKVVKDLVASTVTSTKSTTLATHIIPITKIETLSAGTTGSIFFSSTNNQFYGSGNQTLSPISTRVSGVCNTGVNPTGLAITPDNTKLYVANNNNYSISGSFSVSVIYITTFLPATIINDESFNEPYTVTVNPAGTIAYVTNSAGSTVTMIDVATDTVSGVISGFDGPSGMVIKGTTGYVINYGSDGGVGSGNGQTVSVVNLNTNTITATVDVGQGPAGIAINPAQTFVYTCNYIQGEPGIGTLSVINTSNNTSVIDALSGFSGPFQIAITPDGTKALVTNFGSNNFQPYGTTVSVVSLNPLEITSTITLGIQPSGLAISSNGNAYVSNYNTLYAGPDYSALTAGQGTVNIINLSTMTVIPPTIVVGQSPNIIAISPDGTVGYVSNYTSNTVTSFST